MHVVALFFTLVAASATSGTGSPIDRVVELINGFREKIVADGAAEQKVYDKYACWCEETTARKARFSPPPAHFDLYKTAPQTPRGTFL